MQVAIAAIPSQHKGHMGQHRTRLAVYRKHAKTPRAGEIKVLLGRDFAECGIGMPRATCGLPSQLRTAALNLQPAP